MKYSTLITSIVIILPFTMAAMNPEELERERQSSLVHEQMLKLAANLDKSAESARAATRSDETESEVILASDALELGRRLREMVSHPGQTFSVKFLADPSMSAIITRDTTAESCIQKSPMLDAELDTGDNTIPYVESVPMAACSIHPEKHPVSAQDLRLLTAVQKDEAGTVQDLLRSKANVDTQDDSGWSVLMHAIFKGHDAIAQLLIDAGADSEARRKDGGTPLMAAAFLGNIKIVQTLVDTGADVNAQDNFGRTALMFATERHQTAIAQILIEEGADVNAHDRNGWTALMLATKMGYIKFAEQLIAAGAAIDAHDKKGATAGTIAAESGQTAIAKMLAAAKTQASASSESPLEQIVRENIKKALKRTSVSPAHVKGASSSVEKAPAALAPEKHVDLELSRLLLEATRHNEIERMQSLIAAGANVDAQYCTGWTPLKFAACQRQEEAARILISAGATIDKADSTGLTALWGAARSGCTKIAQMLIDAHATVDTRDYLGETPLICAAYHGNVKIVQALIKAKANINARNKDGQTALICATCGGSTEVVQTLVQAGADLTVRDSKGWTALKWAKKEKRAAAVKVLKAMGAK